MFSTLISKTKNLFNNEKDSNNEVISLFVEQISELVETINIIEKRTTELEEQLELGVVFPGLGMGIVPRDEVKLYMTFGEWGKGIENFKVDGAICELNRHNSLSHNTQFNGNTLKPISYLKNLIDFRFGCYDHCIDSYGYYDKNPEKNKFYIKECPIKNNEFSYLSKCKNLKYLWLVGTSIETIEWIVELKDLEEIILKGSLLLTDISPVLKCSKIRKINIQACPNIRNIPNFASHIEILK